MAEVSRARRKQLAPRRLMDVERRVITWDLSSRLGEVDLVSAAEIESRPKRRKKTNSAASKNDTHTAVPVALHWSSQREEGQNPLVLGYFDVVIHSVLTSFLPLEEESDSLQSETHHSVQSVQLVSGSSESAVSLIVKQTVAELFCCCFNVSVNAVYHFIQPLASLVRSRLVQVSAREDQLHSLFALAARVALSGNVLTSPMSLTLAVHLMDATAFAPASFDTLGQKGAHSKNLTSLISHLNPHACPSHLRPSAEKSVQPVFLSIFKRIQLFYLTVKDLQRREGAVEELTNLGELNRHLPGTVHECRCLR